MQQKRVVVAQKLDAIASKLLSLSLFRKPCQFSSKALFFACACLSTTTSTTTEMQKRNWCCCQWLLLFASKFTFTFVFNCGIQCGKWMRMFSSSSSLSSFFCNKNGKRVRFFCTARRKRMRKKLMVYFCNFPPQPSPQFDTKKNKKESIGMNEWIKEKKTSRHHLKVKSFFCFKITKKKSSFFRAEGGELVRGVRESF